MYNLLASSFFSEPDNLTRIGRHFYKHLSILISLMLRGGFWSAFSV